MTRQNFTPREQLSEEELKQALEHCASEPIHVPGHIQPHGAMIVVDAETEIVKFASQNIERFIEKDVDAILEKPLKEIIDHENLSKMNKIIRRKDLQPLKSTDIEIDEKTFDAVVHISGDYKIIEFESCEAHLMADEERIYEELRDFAIIFQSVSDLSSLYDVIVEEIKKLTGFARVKLYKFDDEWNGMVEAEARNDDMPSYKGLTFPASDIPEQARNLYSKSYLRMISDTTYKPVPLVTKTPDAPQIDMSFAVLRSVSPIHIQYLENINVKASMSVSIMQGGQLWGLVACHHDEPLFVPYKKRVLAEILGHIFSAKLSSMERVEKERRAAQKSLLIEKISAQLNGVIKADDILFGYNEVAMKALGADGLIIHTSHKIKGFGVVPDKATVENFVEVLREQMGDRVIYSRDTEKYLKKLGKELNIKGGFLAAPIGLKGGDIAVWFRRAKTQKTKWAGNPEKPLSKTKAGYRLTPRSSFELWQTESMGKSITWTDADIDAAQSIAQIILEHEKIYAERANLAKTEFLSHMSHELRTPLGAVTGIVQILSEDQSMNEKQRKLIKTLGISAKSLLALLNDLLDIAKIEAGEVTFEKTKFTLNELLEDIRSLMAVKANEKNLNLNISYDSDFPYILHSDINRIRQILINLINNAIKFTDSGFVNVVVTLDNIKENTLCLTFDVIDSGIGIDGDKLDSIFQNFIQEDTSVTRKYGGTGLGLAICKNLAALMDGDISVTSKKGMGSKFTLTLPLQFSKKQGKKKGGKVNKINKGVKRKQPHKKALLVEDYEGNIVTITHYLQNRFYDMHIAKNGHEAIEMLENNNYDVVIMDVQMPVMDGITATRIIRNKQVNGTISPVPILGMTANALQEDRQKCLDAGMDGYLPKPVNLQELDKRLIALIESSKQKK